MFLSSGCNGSRGSWGGEGVFLAIAARVSSPASAGGDPHQGCHLRTIDILWNFLRLHKSKQKILWDRVLRQQRSMCPFLEVPCLVSSIGHVEQNSRRGVGPCSWMLNATPAPPSRSLRPTRQETPTSMMRKHLFCLPSDAIGGDESLVSLREMGLGCACAFMCVRVGGTAGRWCEAEKL